jgi:hypothetical protein
MCTRTAARTRRLHPEDDAKRPPRRALAGVDRLIEAMHARSA